MTPSKRHQKQLPANQIRIEVVSVEGLALGSTLPGTARRLVKSGAALFRRDAGTGKRWIEMTTHCGAVVPEVVAPTGALLGKQA